MDLACENGEVEWGEKEGRKVLVILEVVVMEIGLEEGY